MINLHTTVPSLPDLTHDGTVYSKSGLLEPLDSPWVFKGVVAENVTRHVSLFCSCSEDLAVRPYHKKETEPVASVRLNLIEMKYVCMWGAALWPRTSRDDTIAYLVGQCPHCKAIFWMYPLPELVDDSRPVNYSLEEWERRK